MDQRTPEIPLTVGQRIVQSLPPYAGLFDLAPEIDRAIGIAVRDALRQDREKRADG